MTGGTWLKNYNERKKMNIFKEQNTSQARHGGINLKSQPLRRPRSWTSRIACSARYVMSIHLKIKAEGKLKKLNGRPNATQHRGQGSRPSLRCHGIKKAHTFSISNSLEVTKST